MTVYRSQLSSPSALLMVVREVENEITGILDDYNRRCYASGVSLVEQHTSCGEPARCISCGDPAPCESRTLGIRLMSAYLDFAPTGRGDPAPEHDPLRAAPDPHVVRPYVLLPRPSS